MLSTDLTQYLQQHYIPPLISHNIYSSTTSTDLTQYLQQHYLHRSHTIFTWCKNFGLSGRNRYSTAAEREGTAAISVKICHVWRKSLLSSSLGMIIQAIPAAYIWPTIQKLESPARYFARRLLSINSAQYANTTGSEPPTLHRGRI